MNNRRTIGIVLLVASIVAALIVFVGFKVPPAMGHSAVHLDGEGNTLSRSDSIQFHWSAITLSVLFVVGLVMVVLPKRSKYMSELAVFFCAFCLCGCAKEPTQQVLAPKGDDPATQEKIATVTGIMTDNQLRTVTDALADAQLEDTSGTGVVITVTGTLTDPQVKSVLDAVGTRER